MCLFYVSSNNHCYQFIIVFGTYISDMRTCIVSDKELGATANLLLRSALRQSTQNCYSSAQKKYIHFCAKYHIEPLPATDESLLLYVSYLHEQGLTGSSIKVYMSAVKSLHVYSGFDSPITSNNKVALAIRGAINLSASPARTQPITYELLVRMLPLLAGRQDIVMLKAAMCLAFFGCLRAGEFCLNAGDNFDPAIHLCVRDISMHTDHFTLYLKRSKTDKNNQGVQIHVGCSGELACAFCSMKDFISTRDPNLSPLFQDTLGHILTKSYFVSVTRILLASLGLDPSRFSGHSYRAGSATTGADRGFDQWELKMLGRWSSDAYQIYLRNPKLVSTFSKRLAAHGF